MSNYQQGYDEARLEQYFSRGTHGSAARAGKQLSGLVAGSVLVAGRGLVELVLASPFLVVSYRLTTLLPLHGWPSVALGAGGALGLLAGLVALRGAATAATHWGSRWALLLLVLCGLVCCAGPGLMAGLLVAWLWPTATLWAWGAGLAAALAAARRYELFSGKAPALLGGCYRLGYRTAYWLSGR